MKVNALKCSKCNATIYSRARHDFRRCLCGALAKDGGFDYCKVSYNPDIPYSRVEIEVDATKEELYEDWGSRENKFGLIVE